MRDLGMIPGRVNPRRPCWLGPWTPRRPNYWKGALRSLERAAATFPLSYHAACVAEQWHLTYRFWADEAETF